MTEEKRIGPDAELRELVLRRIQEELDAESNAVDVTAEAGVVTLLGSVRSLADKIAAENAAKGVNQALVIADELAVSPPCERSDTQIARDVMLRLRTHPGLPLDVIGATVTHGEVTLEGTVHWQLQKLTAESIIRNLRGVKRVHNLMRVAPVDAEVTA